MALIKRSELSSVEASEFHDLYVKTAAVELIADNLAGFVANKEFDVHLCHAFLDALEAKTLRDWLAAEGLSVYVDRMDDATVNEEQASPMRRDLLAERFKNCKAIVFVTSEDWTHSVWMPWHMGYFDALGYKVAVLPIHDGELDKAEFKGQEYLGIYPYIDRGPIGDDTGIHFRIRHQDPSSPLKYLKDWIHA